MSDLLGSFNCIRQFHERPVSSPRTRQKSTVVTVPPRKPQKLLFLALVQVSKTFTRYFPISNTIKQNFTIPVFDRQVFPKHEEYKNLTWVHV